MPIIFIPMFMFAIVFGLSMDYELERLLPAVDIDGRAGSPMPAMQTGPFPQADRATVRVPIVGTEAEPRL